MTEKASRQMAETLAETIGKRVSNMLSLLFEHSVPALCEESSASLAKTSCIGKYGKFKLKKPKVSWGKQIYDGAFKPKAAF